MALYARCATRTVRSAPSVEPVATKAATKVKPPRFASFRDDDGSFRFRLFGTDGEELLLSTSFADPKAAGVLRQTLSTVGGTKAVIESQGDHVAWLVNGEVVANGASYPDEVARAAAVLRLRTAASAQDDRSFAGDTPRHLPHPS